MLPDKKYNECNGKMPQYIYIFPENNRPLLPPPRATAYPIFILRALYPYNAHPPPTNIGLGPSTKLNLLQTTPLIFYNVTTSPPPSFIPNY